MLEKSSIHRPVFFSSTLIICCLTLLGAIWPLSTEQFFAKLQNTMIHYTGWLYILGVAIFLIFLVFLMFSRFGEIKLGMDHEEPNFSLKTWISMLFSAGMGIGLMFYGVAEPLMHFLEPPVGEPASIAIAKEALKITFFHWGLHAWAIYAIVALSLAYFSYRHHLPLLPRAALHPLIGNKIYGPIGDMIDSFAVIGTMFGIATSLGISATQVNSGLNYLFDVPINHLTQVCIILIITLCATLSVVSGLNKGIKKLSNLNMGLAIFLVLLMLCVGPTINILKAFVQNTGNYFSDLVHITFNLYAYQKKEEWLGGWTLFYWSWWVSWSPFVGIFIARISKGRTIREFLIGVLFVPSLFAFFWFTVFGNSAIELVLSDSQDQMMSMIKNNLPVALFVFFEHFPFSQLLSILSLVLMVTFFVSSSDSGSLVIDTLTSKHDSISPTWQRVFWAVSEGVIAAVLLYMGGLHALQTLTITSSFPLLLIIFVYCYSLFKTLSTDYLLQTNVQDHPTMQYTKASVPWRDQVANLSHYPKTKESNNFLHKTVLTALEELSAEMNLQGLNTYVDHKDETNIRLTVLKEGVEDFYYGIELREFVLPDYVDENHKNYFRAEVFLLRGGQQYNVMGYTKEQIIADVISQYQRHMQFIYLTTNEEANS